MTRITQEQALRGMDAYNWPKEPMRMEEIIEQKVRDDLKSITIPEKHRLAFDPIDERVDRNGN